MGKSNLRAAFALGLEAGNLAAEGKALTDLIQTAAYPQPDEALGLVDRAREINSGIHNRVELVKIHAATAIAHTLTGNPKAAETEIRDGLTLTGDCHYPGGAVWCWTARALAALRADDRDGHIRAVARITDITDTIGGNRFWARITAWWGEPDTAPTGGDSTIRWIGGTLAARQRWRTVHPGTP